MLGIYDESFFFGGSIEDIISCVMNVVDICVSDYVFVDFFL